MASINASTSGPGGIITSGDTSGNLNLQSGGTTVVAVSSTGLAVTGNTAITGNVAITGTLTASGTSFGNSTLKTITDTTDITLVNIASSYVTVGSSFSVSIPTTGFIKVGSFAGRLTYVSGANETMMILGLRIGTTNYWLGTTSVNGTARYAPITTLTGAAGYEEYYGAPKSYNGYLYGETAMVSDIVASSIPTGTQTVQLIAAAHIAVYSGVSILKGTTTTTRVGLEFVSSS
jgi:hypothetical protein